MRHRLTRRYFVTLAITTGAAAVAVACGGQAPAAPTAAKPAAQVPPPAQSSGSAPPAQTSASVPPAQANTPPPQGAAPTPAAQSTPAPAAVKPAATAAVKTEARIGRQLYGKLEGPSVVTDPAQYPKQLAEAPQLADLVKQGKLPPVQDRVGADPLVIRPLRETGRYGGTWRRGFTGPGDWANGIRTAAHDHILFLDYKAQTVVPNVARSWRLSEDARTTTISLRKGMRWSDGHPFTADDFVFAFEDLYKNKDLNPSPAIELSINGKPGMVEKVDDLTVRYVFADPYYLFPDVLAGFATIASHAAWGRLGIGGFAPAHYLKQFLPKYSTPDELDRKAREAKFDGWLPYFKFKSNWTQNAELPVVTPWKTTTPANSPTWTLERNPYFYGVDVAGNQLPYIDKIVMNLGENLEVINLRAIAGEYDFQARHIDLQKLPVLLDNQAKGDYTVRLDPGDFGSNAQIRINMSFAADPELATWFANRDFRRALALGIERDQINETFFLGLGLPSSVVPADDNPYNPGPEYRTLWATFDAKKANETLDAIGLAKKDGQGFRLRQDGKGRLRLDMQTYGGQFVPYTQIAEMIKQQWGKIGIELNVQEVERTLGEKRIASNEVQLFLWDNGGTERLFGAPSNTFAAAPDSSFGPLFGQWFASNGKAGKEPPGPMKQMMESWRRGFGVPENERVRLGKDFWRIYAEEVYVIGVIGFSPATSGVRVVKNKLGNVPERQVFSLDGISPGISRPETFYWKA